MSEHAVILQWQAGGEDWGGLSKEIFQIAHIQNEKHLQQADLRSFLLFFFLAVQK